MTTNFTDAAQASRSATIYTFPPAAALRLRTNVKHLSLRPLLTYSLA